MAISHNYNDNIIKPFLEYESLNVKQLKEKKTTAINFNRKSQKAILFYLCFCF